MEGMVQLGGHHLMLRGEEESQVHTSRSTMGPAAASVTFASFVCRGARDDPPLGETPAIAVHEERHREPETHEGRAQ